MMHFLLSDNTECAISEIGNAVLALMVIILIVITTTCRGLIVISAIMLYNVIPWSISKTKNKKSTKNKNGGHCENGKLLESV